MKYFSGQRVKLRDMVNLGNGEKGKVVAVNEDHKFLDSSIQHHFHYISNGVVFDTDFGYLHYDHLDCDITLIKRGHNVDSLIVCFLLSWIFVFSMLFYKNT